MKGLFLINDRFLTFTSFFFRLHFGNVASFVILHSKEPNKLSHVLLLLTEIQEMDYQFTKLQKTIGNISEKESL